ncbi:MAG: hypothetical protein WAW02_06790 [Sideroxyarcus sp.]
MPIKSDPDESREITLRRWRVIEIEAPDGTRSRHVWGHDVKNDRGRASSPIMEFNLETMIAISRSGSNYKLLGLPGNSRLGKGAWNRWCRHNEIVSEVDVTNEYMNIDQLSTAKLAKFNSTVE